MMEKFCELMELCFENDLGWLIEENFIREEDINDYIQDMDWLLIKNTLESITWHCDEWFHIDGYGHLENITWEILECLEYDLKHELEEVA